MLFDLLLIIESYTGFVKRLSGKLVAIDDVRTDELVQIAQQALLNNLNYNQDAQPGHWSLIVRVEMFSVNFVTFAFCKLFFCFDILKMSPILMLFK